MNNVLIHLFTSILFFIVIVFAILNYSIKNKKFTCNKYLLNTYLYILLTINIIAILLPLLEYNNIAYRLPLALFALIFIGTLICIYLLHTIDSTNIIIKHLVWLIFILGIGVILYPMYISYKDNKYLIANAFLTTIILFLVLSAIAYIKPELISLSWGPVLFFLLLGGIIMELGTLLIYRKQIGTKKLSPYLRAFSYFFIVLFMIFILYDTKRLQINAKNCVKADYIKESLGLFLDILNIFVRILGLGRR